MPRLGLREWIAVGRVMARGDILRTTTRNGEVERFERAMAKAAGTEHCLAVSSGTTALVCGLQALGIGPGDEVLVSAYTWMASAAAVLQVGAMPVLVEIDETLTMDPDDLLARITPRSRAVMPVHMINRVCDMDRILDIARRHGLFVIEDASQAVGVRYKDKACGTMGDVGVFSFNQFKNMTCGEGGALLTRDARLHHRAYCAHDIGVSFRDLDAEEKEAAFLGSNYRISEIQGAILNVQLARLQPRLRRVARRTRMIESAFKSASVPMAPYAPNGPALSPAITFDTEEEAIAFSQRRGAWRIFDKSKHVYLYWDAILEKRMAHPKVDPWAWAGNQPGITADACPRTLNIMRRTCALNPGPDLPAPIVAASARRLARSV